ncbi:flagellar biosynthesis protein FlhB [Solemya pervernicosa gill symbiont]|uniref:Flagellar biosynthetic protein FlhB n=1 Tax=Solemya pervernicosa gill symbiont TaxID=642797 RepID=A0A1T2LAL1_9GAMM|nr:flagellar biosynthesis protein FlhB [Solemya pervernicosa gill symbiont]OOZ42137.1 flagellar biosynthesis protein FlhB [Solemya pervernicosa gill symbiont]
MAQDEGQERTEEATPKRQREAREKGQIPRSRELGSMTMLMVAATGLLVMGEGMLKELVVILQQGFSIDRSLAFDKVAAVQFMIRLFSEALFMMAPFLLLLTVAAFLPPVVMGGWSFSWKAVAPKWNKLDPIKGLKRVFGPRGLMELIKAVAKFSVVAMISATILWQWSEEFFGLAAEPLQQGLAHSAELVTWSFLAMSAALILIALVDVPFQLWDHSKQLKMTRQEVKDEYKDTEGKPEVKARVRQMQYEMSQRRMMDEVPQADVVVTNPTHFAVALKYEQDKGGAPKVVAKGADLIAAQIRNIATEHDVPIFAAPPLARAIFYNTELDQEIPAGLYVAVAQVLAYVYQVRIILREGGVKPPPPDDLPVPDEFLKRDQEQANGPEQGRE